LKRARAGARRARADHALLCVADPALSSQAVQRESARGEKGQGKETAFERCGVVLGRASRAHAEAHAVSSSGEHTRCLG